MADQKDDSKKEVDAELDDLLDSALQDMTKKPDEKKETPNDEVASNIPQNMWSEEFIKEAASQFESNMAAILGNFSGMPEDQITQEQIAQTFSKMAEAAAQVLKPGADGTSDNQQSLPTNVLPTSPEGLDEVSAAISETLKNLNSNAENLQTPFSDQDLSNMFNNFNLGDGNQDGNTFVPFMQGMMQSLLSKEVLYPSLKDLIDKYPAWLAENKGKVEASEYARFEKQNQLMVQICNELEPEQESDPEEVKRKRFEVVLELMQRMQDLGQPPTELVGDMSAAPVGFAPPSPQDPSQCCVM